MKINDFFQRLESDFNITPYEYCKIKPISYQSLKKFLKGTVPSKDMAKTIVDITAQKVTFQDLGIKE